MTLSDYLILPGNSASQVAKDLGVSHTTVLRWADGSMDIPLSRMKQIKVATGGLVSPNDFLPVPSEASP